jgi:hypothetical protein
VGKEDRLVRNGGVVPVEMDNRKLQRAIAPMPPRLLPVKGPSPSRLSVLKMALRRLILLRIVNLIKPRLLDGRCDFTAPPIQYLGVDFIPDP